MRTSLHLFALSCIALIAAAAQAASVADINVTVANDAGGAIAFKGKLDARGNFATGSVSPGTYTVVFRSSAPSLKGDQFSIRVAGGKQKMSADGVAGEKFAAGGVAMKIEVAKPSTLGGNIISQKAAASQSVEKGNTKVKIVNGKRYYWMRPETGSHMGGRWVEESEISASNVRSYDAGGSP